MGVQGSTLYISFRFGVLLTKLELHLSDYFGQENCIVCAGAILKDQPVCYGTSRLKNRVCAVTQCALLKTPTLKSNKR